jgi:hypothetical protein
MSLTSSNSMRTSHFLRAPDIDPLGDDDYASWEYDADEDDSNLDRTPVTGCEFEPTIADLRQVRKAYEAACTSARPFNGI